MAHFALLNESNEVIQTIVICNEDLLDKNGIEDETLGIELCKKIVRDGTWVQTSYNRNFRKNFGTVGYSYDPIGDAFYQTKSPKPWYVLDENFSWVCPIGIKDHNGEVITDDEWLWLEKVFSP
jgi:hypothetical protein